MTLPVISGWMEQKYAYIPALLKVYENLPSVSSTLDLNTWFDGKLSFSPPVRDFSQQGFPLQGGRLDVLDGRAIAALVFGRRKHEINVFVWPNNAMPEGVRSGSQQGYNWIQWNSGGFEFWAVSDAALADLQELRQLFESS